MLLLLLTLAAFTNVAAAATLNVQAGSLLEFSAPVERCYSDISLMRVTKGSNLVGFVGYGVDPSCAGETVTALVVTTTGTPISVSIPNITVGGPSFTMPLPPTPAISSTAQVDVVVASDGFPLERVVPSVIFDLHVNEYPTERQLQVTARGNTNLSGSEYWVDDFALLLDRAPLTGEFCAGKTPFWGDASVSIDTNGVMTTGPVSWDASKAYVSANQTRTVTACLKRDVPPVDPEADIFITDFDIYDDWTKGNGRSGFNATVTLESEGIYQASPWEFVLDFSELGYGVPAKIDSLWMPGKNAPSYNYSNAPLLVITADHQDHWIDDWTSVTFHLGVDNIPAGTYPGPGGSMLSLLPETGLAEESELTPYTPDDDQKVTDPIDDHAEAPGNEKSAIEPPPQPGSSDPITPMPSDDPSSDGHPEGSLPASDPGNGSKQAPADEPTQQARQGTSAGTEPLHPGSRPPDEAQRQGSW